MCLQWLRGKLYFHVCTVSCCGNINDLTFIQVVNRLICTYDIFKFHNYMEERLSTDIRKHNVISTGALQKVFENFVYK